MTIQSYYYKKPSEAAILPKINSHINIKKIKRSGISYVEGINGASKNKFVLVGIIGLFVVLALSYIYNLSEVTRLGYQIYDLKTNITAYEKENAELKSQLVRNASSDTVARWAESNGFVKNEAFSYYEVKNQIIAVKTSNF